MEKIYIKQFCNLLSILDQSLLVIPLHSEKKFCKFGCYSGLPRKHGYHENYCHGNHDNNCHGYHDNLCFKKNYRISSFKGRSVYLVLGLLSVVLIRGRRLLQKSK